MSSIEVQMINPGGISLRTLHNVNKSICSSSDIKTNGVKDRDKYKDKDSVIDA